MAKGSTLAFLLTICVTFLLVEGRHTYTSVSVGDPCQPSSPRSCSRDDPLLVDESVEEAGDSYGPNVCVTSKTYEVRSYMYQYASYCRRSRFRCRLVCTRTNACEARNVSVTKVGCCEGFALNDSSTSHGGHALRYYHRRPSPLRTEGCPIVLMGTVLDCLNELNLTELVTQLGRTELEAILSSSDRDLTIFAPSNDAISDLDLAGIELLSDDNVNTTFAAHIVGRQVSGKRLFHGDIISPLAEDRRLHVTEVYSGSWRERSEHTFINGAEVIDADACRSRNGIVHVVDSVIPTSTSTITELLDADDLFSSFVSLLDESGALVHLNRTKKSRTVFAPTNAAFDDLPAGAVECLQRPENRWALRTLVYIHISQPAEYTSSLALCNYLPTFSGFSLVLNGTADDIRITRDGIPLENANIPAKNGVIHTIATVVVPDCIDFDELCPDMPAPEPSPTVAPSSSADPVVMGTVAIIPGGSPEASPGPGNVIIEPGEIIIEPTVVPGLGDP